MAPNSATTTSDLAMNFILDLYFLSIRLLAWF